MKLQCACELPTCSSAQHSILLPDSTLKPTLPQMIIGRKYRVRERYFQHVNIDISRQKLSRWQYLPCEQGTDRTLRQRLSGSTYPTVPSRQSPIQPWLSGDLDFDINARRQVEPLERIDRLRCVVHDVEQALVYAHFEMLAGILVFVG